MSKGAERIAESATIAIGRRRFVRMAANRVFAAACLVATGTIVRDLLSQTAVAVSGECAGQADKGLGCPGSQAGFPCGPSRCCNYTTGRPNNCDCGKGNANCKTQADSPNCYGDDHRHYSGGCWTCIGDCLLCSQDPVTHCKKVTTCCDCKTNANNCNDNDLGSNRGRCIAYDTNTINC
jgi:hypothetical protein